MKKSIFIILAAILLSLLQTKVEADSSQARGKLVLPTTPRGPKKQTRPPRRKTRQNRCRQKISWLQKKLGKCLNKKCLVRTSCNFHQCRRTFLRQLRTLRQKTKTLREKIETLEEQKVNLEEDNTKLALRKSALVIKESSVSRKTKVLEEKETRLLQWEQRLKKKEGQLGGKRKLFKIATIDYNKWKEARGIRVIRCIIPVAARNRDIGETIVIRDHSCFYRLRGHTYQTKCRIDMTWTCTYARPILCGVTILATCKVLPWSYKGRSQRRGRIKRYRFPSPWYCTLKSIASF